MKRRFLLILGLTVFTVFAVVLFLAGNRKPEISHIVLISMDTTRADHIGCYGYPREITPNIDAVAAQGVRFEHVVSPAPITLPAHSSMLTGTIPPFHGVHNNIGYKLASENLTLAEVLKKNAFHTAAFISSFVLDRKMGLDQGFDLYSDQFEKLHRNRFGRERKGDETTQVVLQWLDQSKDKKAFLFLHYYDPHIDYAPPEPFASEFADNPYAGEIAFTDKCIGQVVQKLKELGIYDSTLLIITGDHGEMLGDHGEVEHSYFIYESAIRVPLIVKLPGRNKDLVISEPVGLVDIVPTICSLLDIDFPGTIHGMDLSPLLRGDVPEGYERFLYSESMGPTRIGVSSLMAITTGLWKFIQAPRAELYNILSDPGEETNLVERERQRARILEDKLKEILEESVRSNTDSGIELDAESIRRLESLGYVAGKAEEGIVFDENQDDPKDFIHSFEQFHRALSLRDEQRYGEAKEVLRGIIPDRPDFGELYIKLGDIALIEQQYNEAIRSYRRADQLGLPLLPSVYNNLAWLQATRPMLASRDVNEAVRYAVRVCQLSNYAEPSALDTLAVAYAAAGDYSMAVKTAEKAYKLVLARKGPKFTAKIEGRLDLFRQSKPFIEH